MNLNNHQSFKALRVRRSGAGDVAVDVFSRINEWVKARNWQEFVFSFCLFWPVQLNLQSNVCIISKHPITNYLLHKKEEKYQLSHCSSNYPASGLILSYCTVHSWAH